MPQFIAQGLDKANTLVNLLGSFWSGTYGGRLQVQEMLFARQQSAAQTYQRWNETLAALSPTTVPIWRKFFWYPVRLLESQKIGLGKPAYGEAWQFSEPAQRNFSDEPYLGYPAGNLSVCRLLMNNIYDGPAGLQHVTLRHGPDFHIDMQRKQIIFTVDPFADPRLIPKVLKADSTTEDRELIFWAPGAEADENTIWRQFGIAFKLSMQSSPQSLAAMNAIYNGLADGNPVLAVKQLLGALFEMPLAGTDEQVEEVFTDQRATWVVTDKQAYRYNRAANTTVAVGDTLTPHQFLSDGITVQDFRFGRVPDDLDALVLSDRQLGSTYFQGLVFENKIVPLVIEPDVDGYTKVSFAIGGFSADIERFWNEIHRKGVAAGQTLAMLLDTRGTEATNQPSSVTLPVTINPVQFLAENVFRNNAILIRLKSAQLPQPMQIKRQLRHLSRLIPAHVGLVVVVELAQNEEPVTIQEDQFSLLNAMTATSDFIKPVDSLRFSAVNNDICA